jgi:predicted NBD/HSP70 family sugar kinase
MRRYNEQLILSVIRRLGEASKAELARLTALSPQAVVRIVDQLEIQGYIYEAGRRTGGMGQPAILYRINSDHGFTVGVEIGRNGLIMALVDFDGQVKAVTREMTGFPSVSFSVSCIRSFIDKHITSDPLLLTKTFKGIGIAMPWFLGEWRQEIHISVDQADEWRAPGLAERLKAGLEWPVTFENDGNAATLAHLLCGVGQELQNFLTIHFGTLIGGGLAMGGRIVRGLHGNAGALASMPIGGRSQVDYLVHRASLYTLPADACEHAAWVAQCADALAFVIMGVNSLLDLEAIILDGALPTTLLENVVEKLSHAMATQGPIDLFKPVLLQGTFRDLAVATGAALLPLHSAFAPDFATLFKAV